MRRPSALTASFGATAKTLLRRVGVAVGAGLLLATLGPFGSYMNPGGLQHAGYWVAAMLLGLGLALYGMAHKLVSSAIAPSSRLRWPAVVGAALLVSIPQTLATRWGAFRLWPELEHRHLPLLTWFAQTATIVLIAMAAMSIFFLRRTAAVPPGDVPPQAALPAQKGLLGRDVLALQMEDHYVRVHRAAGTELFLISLGRAIECLDIEGIRTHRSWWVAREAVASVEGHARSMRIHLSNGVVVPVARSAVTHLRAAGWITGDPAKHLI
jgi:hypothetical protein